MNLNNIKKGKLSRSGLPFSLTVYDTACNMHMRFTEQFIITYLLALNYRIK